MRKLVTFTVSLLAVLVLTGCSYDIDYYTNNTMIEMGADACYVSGSEVSIDPIIRVGYLEEEVEDDDGDRDSKYIHWMIEEITYSLEKEMDGSFVNVESDLISTGLNDNQYQEEYVYYEDNVFFDYETTIDYDMFDFGELDKGRYRVTVTVDSKYMAYQDQNGTSDLGRISDGLKTHEVTEVVDFEVSDDCGVSDFEGAILFQVQNDQLLFSFIGVDNEGNSLTFDDVTILDQITNNFDDFSFYEYWDEDDYYFYGLNIDEGQEYEFNNIAREKLYDSSYDYDQGSTTLLENFIHYRDSYFNTAYWNGNTLREYLLEYTNNYSGNPDDNFGLPTDYYITTKINETNIYKDVLVVTSIEENAPVFSNVPMDQWIEVGTDLDLEAIMPSATDDTEGDISERIEVELPDTTMLPLGDHVITYTVSDIFGNEATASFTLSVLPPDEVAPVITVNQTLPTTFDEGSPIPNLLSYFTVMDDRDGDIPVTLSMLSFDPMLDMNTPGSYDVTLTVTDSSGNEQTEMIALEVVLVDNEAPLIGLTNEVQLFFDEGTNGPDFTTYFTVLDNIDGAITVTESMITFDTPFDTDTPGVYTLTLTVQDNAGNIATEVLAITVVEFVDSTSPVFDNIPMDQIITEGDFLDLYDLGLTVSDDVDGDLTPFIQVNIMDTSVLSVGNYTVTYTATDMAGNIGTTTITLTVNQATPDYSGNVVSAVATTSTDIDVVFDVFVLDNLVADPTAFSVIVNGTQVTVTGVEVVLDNVVVSIDTHMTINGVVTVSYSASGISDLTHEFVLVPDFTNQVVDTSDFEAGSGGGNEETGDVIAAVATDQNTIDILFDVVTIENTQLDITAFTVTIDGTQATITNGSIISGSVSLTVTEAMGEFSTITVSYSPTGTNDLVFDNGRPISGYINFSVVPPFGGGNGSYTGDVLVAVAFDANTIDVTFDIDTFDSNLVDLSAFTVNVDGVQADITGAFVNINTVSLTIIETMDELSFIELSYSPTGTNDLSFGGTPIDDFIDEPVIPPTEGGFPGF